MKKEKKVVDTHNICTCQIQNIVSNTTNCSDKSRLVKTYHISYLGWDVQAKEKWFYPYCVRKKQDAKNQNRNFSIITFWNVFLSKSNCK